MPTLVNGKQKRRPKPPQRYCPYCSKDRAITNFPDGSGICKFCVNFDKAAQITAPPADPLQAIKYPMPNVPSIFDAPQDLGNQ